MNVAENLVDFLVSIFTRRNFYLYVLSVVSFFDRYLSYVRSMRSRRRFQIEEDRLPRGSAASFFLDRNNNNIGHVV